MLANWPEMKLKLRRVADVLPRVMNGVCGEKRGGGSGKGEGERE